MKNIGVSLTKSINKGHRFIQSTGKPMNGMVTMTSLLVTNQYFNKDLGAAKWRKEKRTWNVNWEETDGRKMVSKPINYNIISSFIREKQHFDALALDLPYMGCMWMDHSTEMKLDFHMYDGKETLGLSSGDLQTHYYGSNYPIVPTLRREGHLYTSFQPLLIARIIADRKRLIADSENALTDDWVFDFRNLVSNSISLLEIALTQFYIKAQYDPLPNWKFDKEKIGERHGRRLNDKLKWIYQIGGRPFNIEAEQHSIESLRVLRNHLMHFDPPSLVITLEEVTIWLNQIIDIGKVLIKMRQALGIEVSEILLNFVLQEEAIFIAPDASARKPLQLDSGDGYQSSVWPKG